MTLHTDAHPDIQEIARRVHVEDDHTVFIDGACHRLALGNLWNLSDPGSARPSEFCQLAALIYRCLYIRPRRPWSAEDDPGAVREFRRSLSRLDLGRETWSDGWVFERMEPVQAVFSWQGVEFAVSTRGYPVAEIEAGSGLPCAVRIPVQQWGLHPGYGMVLGERPWPETDSTDAAIARIYWNVTASGVAVLLGTATRALNRCGARFRIKVLDRPGAYRRADAAVLYLPLQDWDQTQDAIAAIYRAAWDDLVPEEPMLTLPLAPGVGFAQDPGNGPSFGEARCEHLAQAMRSALRRGHTDASAVGAEVEARFRTAGLDPARPYLNAGAEFSPDQEHQIPPVVARPEHGREIARISRSTHEPPAGDELLDIAAMMGGAICRQAYWDREGVRCTWLGRTFEVDPASGKASPTSLVASLSPRLYDGLPGVALALAELWALRPAPVLRRTALGALATAAHRVRDGGPRSRLSSGFYTGTTGITYAAKRIVRLTESGEEAPDVRVLFEARSEHAANDAYDVIDGRAGEILALLASSVAGSPVVGSSGTGPAAAFGTELARSLDTSRPSFGLAHGDSGTAAALFALHRRTGNEVFLQRGRAAIAREDALAADPAVGDGAEKGRGGASWCNGAAGVAMSRLMALACDPEGISRYGAAAYVALADTAAALDPTVTGVDDLSLCHGLAGLAETLRIGARLLHDEALATAAARGTAACASAWRSRPDALDAAIRRDPSLMVGVAGVLHALLRAAAPDRVAPVLLGPIEP